MMEVAEALRAVGAGRGRKIAPKHKTSLSVLGVTTAAISVPKKVKLSLASDTFWSILCMARCAGAETANHPTTPTLPPPCFTAGMMLILWNAGKALWYLCLPKSSTFISVHIIPSSRGSLRLAFNLLLVSCFSHLHLFH